MNGDVYLGRCEYPGDGWAKLEVLAVWHHEYGWQEIGQEARRSKFPNEGIVYCGEPTIRVATQDSAWVFETIENPKYSGGVREKYNAHRIAPAVEMLDLRSYGGHENARRAVVERGLDLEHPPTAEVVVRLTDETCVALHLTERSAPAMRWQASNLEALRHLPIYRFDAAFEVGGAEGRLFLPPHKKIQDVIGVEDWSPDVEYLKRLLRRVKKAEPMFTGRPSNAEIEQTISKLGNAKCLSLDEEENELLRQRLDVFLPMLEGNIVSITTIVERLMEFPTIKDALDAQMADIRTKAAEEVRKQLEPSIRTEIERSLASIRESMDREKAELQAIQNQVKRAGEEIRELSAARDEARALLASELTATACLTQDAATEDRLAYIAAGQAIRIQMMLGATPRGAEADPPPWLATTLPAARPIQQGELPSVLETAANAFGVADAALSTLDVLARAAQVPLLFGPDVRDVTLAYAFSVAGGVIHHHRADPTTIALEDLWRHPGTREPTGVAYSWRMAQAHPEKTVLLLVDGLDLAPSEFWFDTWCDVVRSDRRPPNLIILTALSETTPPSRKPVEIYLAGAPLHLRPREMSMGEHLALFLSAGSIAPTVLEGMTRSEVGLDEKKEFAMAIAGQEIRSQSFLRRALSVHAAARGTYGDEMATALVQDFFFGLDPTMGPRSDKTAQGLVAQSVESLKKLLAIRF